MSTLDQLFKDLQRRGNPSTTLIEGEVPVDIHFRLWLTSKPSSFFPVSVLQSSVKLTKEPPSGLKANISSSMCNDIVTEPGFYNGIQKGPAAIAFKKLLFSLCLLHATVQERRSFGSIGWNVPYGFSESDIRISLRQLRSVFITYNKPKEIIIIKSETEKQADYEKQEELNKIEAKRWKKLSKKEKEEEIVEKENQKIQMEKKKKEAEEKAERIDKDWSQQSKDIENSIPWQSLRYSIGACNYGGRVTDSKDRVLLNTMVRDYLDPKVVTALPLPSHSYTSSHLYNSPDCYPGEYDHDEMLQYISTMPETANANIFGLHENASVSRQRFESLQLLRTWLTVQPAPTASKQDDGEDEKNENENENDGNGNGNGNEKKDEDNEETEDNKKNSSGGAEEQVSSSASEILSRITEESLFDMLKLKKKFPTRYEDSMNSVLCQELDRFNGLLKVIRSSLFSVQRAAAGVEVMSDELELVFQSIFNGQVPTMWKSKSYPTLKSLTDYINDLCLRLDFFNGWIAKGDAPSSLWLPGFFFTHAVMTGSLQNFCRKHHHAIDHVEFGYEPFSSKQEDTAFDCKPETGIYVYGFYVEGAKWSDVEMGFEESEPRTLYTRLPVLWMKPRLRDGEYDESELYNCPLYNTSERRGMLSTTGHSTNFIMYLKIGSGECNPDHWCKRGSACLMQLD